MQHLIMNAFSRISVVLLLGSLRSLASDSTLVNMGDTWSYVKVPFQVAEPAKAWSQPEFDDSQWRVTSSGFDLEHRQ